MKIIKKQIIENYKLLLQKGFNIGAEGNISVRSGEKVFITPSGLDIKDLQPENISIVNIKGKIINKIKPSSEIDLHLQLYRNRDEFNSIVHCHSNWASILSCMREDIKKFHYMIAEFGGDNIKCSKYATFGTKKLATYVLKACELRKGCLIANHGQICMGKDINEAVHLSQALEKLSKQYYFSLLSKKINYLSRNQINDVLKIFPSYKPKR